MDIISMVYDEQFTMERGCEGTQWAQVHLLNVLNIGCQHCLNLRAMFKYVKKGPQIWAKNNVYTSLALNI